MIAPRQVVKVARVEPRVLLPVQARDPLDVLQRRLATRWSVSATRTAPSRGTAPATGEAAWIDAHNVRRLPPR
jgi:hypothetical protein